MDPLYNVFSMAGVLVGLVYNYCAVGTVEKRQECIMNTVKEWQERTKDCPHCNLSSLLSGNTEPETSTSGDPCPPYLSSDCCCSKPLEPETSKFHTCDVKPPTLPTSFPTTEQQCVNNPGKITKNGFLNYVREKRGMSCIRKQTEIVRNAAEEWRNLSVEEKQRYTDLGKRARRNNLARPY